ncbi:YtzI protein [Halobacillus yeomjeoni]|nr:YtzI protein [Halobacillus yeomjeoni]MCA0984603.1 YtzI protein [Halobacillus yeomjeoni]
MIVCVGIVLGIAAMFGFAVSKGYEYKHTIDPLPEKADKYEPDHKKADAN